LSCADIVEFSCTIFAEKFPSGKPDGNESCQTRENSIFLRYPGLVLDFDDLAAYASRKLPRHRNDSPPFLRNHPV